MATIEDKRHSGDAPSSRDNLTDSEHPWTEENDLDIVNHIIQLEAFSELENIEVWNRMVNEKVVPGRSAKQLKERFFTQVLTNLSAFATRANQKKFAYVKKVYLGNTIDVQDNNTSKDHNVMLGTSCETKNQKRVTTSKAIQETIELPTKNMYTIAEDLVILHEIAKAKISKPIGGLVFWKSFVERQKVKETGRSWPSLKGRFNKISKNGFVEYNLPNADMKYLNEIKKKSVRSSSDFSESGNDATDKGTAVTRNTVKTVGQPTKTTFQSCYIPIGSVDNGNVNVNDVELNLLSKTVGSTNNCLGSIESRPEKHRNISNNCAKKGLSTNKSLPTAAVKIVNVTVEQPGLECPTTHKRQDESDQSEEEISSDDDRKRPKTKEHKYADPRIESTSNVVVVKSSNMLNACDRQYSTQKNCIEQIRVNDQDDYECNSVIQTTEQNANTSQNLSVLLGHNVMNMLPAISKSTPATMVPREEEAVKFVRHIVRQFESKNEEAKMLADVTLKSLVQTYRHMKFILDKKS